MTYTENGDRVTLDLTRDQYERLVMALGFAAGGAAAARDDRQAHLWLDLANQINEGNPRWTPYEIPADIRRRYDPRPA